MRYRIKYKAFDIDCSLVAEGNVDQVKEAIGMTKGNAITNYSNGCNLYKSRYLVIDSEYADRILSETTIPEHIKSIKRQRKWSRHDRGSKQTDSLDASARVN